MPEAWDDTCADTNDQAVQVAARRVKADDTGASAPTDYRISTLPETTSLKELRIAKIRWRIEHDYLELKTGLGLTHLKGRIWAGWPHHAILVTAAHLFITTVRLTLPKRFGSLSLYGILRELQHLAAARTGYYAYCEQRAGPT